jgi:hypothetical protein
LNGVALPFGRLLFPDLCLNMKSNVFSDSEWCPDSVAISSGRMHWSTENLLDTKERPDASLAHPDGCNGSDFYLVKSVQNLLGTSEIAFLKLVTLTFVINRYYP